MRKIHALIALSVLTSASLLYAADTTLSAPLDSELENARALIESENWPAAQQALETYVQAHPESADGYNLLGYSYRNQKSYDKSFAAYDKALALDSDHRGAHEYIGIAYIQTGQLDKAKEHLARLDDICFFGCEEYDDLKEAIEKTSDQSSS